MAMRPRELRLLVMHVSTRCDQTCAHCSVWKGSEARDLGEAERLATIRHAHGLGARTVLFTGGEPLLCDHIESLANCAADLGLSVQITTNGLGLARSLPWLGRLVEEVCVSLEGPPEIHDRVRGPRMFARLHASIGAVLSLPQRPRIVARCTVSAWNTALLPETVKFARGLGVDGVSFLPIDVTSGAFGGDPGGRKTMWPAGADTEELEHGIVELEAAGELGGFVIEDAPKLRRMVAFFRREAGSSLPPRCNAPEWSSVVEADGALRPCFFQPPVSSPLGASVMEIRNSLEYGNALRALGPGNAICGACVCPKYLEVAAVSAHRRLAAVIGRTVAPWFGGSVA